MANIRRVAVLLTCHNRRVQTVACLHALDNAFRHYRGGIYHAYVTDDGSTDGTSAALRSLAFPITVLDGAGDLYWNRGMVRSWRAAEKDRDGFDGYLLLNDDTVLDVDGISNLMVTSASLSERAIVVGAVRDPDSGYVTYGGVVRMARRNPGRVRRLDSSPSLQFADTFNANCAYVPATIASAVGTLDPMFQHSMGDFDYGYRAGASGYKIVVAPNTVGICTANSVRGTWRDSTEPLQSRLRLLSSPKGLPYGEWREFLRRHGAAVPSLLAAAPYIRVVSSSILRRRRRIREDSAIELHMISEHTVREDAE